MKSVWRFGASPQASVPALVNACRSSNWRIAALLTVTMLAAGCAVAVGGTARPAPNLAPRSLSGRTIERVLLGDSALSRIVKQPLNIDPLFPPIFGGPETLRGGPAAWPADCVGVLLMMQQSAYQSSNVKNVALQTWRPEAMSAAVTRVKEGVVSLPTAADADALFANFSRQWQTCDGKTIPMSEGMFGLKVKVTDVQASSSVVAATISIGPSLPVPHSPSIPAGRAIGVRGNCLVEVEVDFSNGPKSSPGSGDINATALDIAQIMRDKVTALS